jgi:hypothetical protein
MKMMMFTRMMLFRSIIHHQMIIFRVRLFMVPLLLPLLKDNLLKLIRTTWLIRFLL